MELTDRVSQRSHVSGLPSQKTLQVYLQDEEEAVVQGCSTSTRRYRVKMEFGVDRDGDVSGGGAPR